MQLKYKKGSCAKKGIGKLGTYFEDGLKYSFYVPIKTRGAGENSIIEYSLQYYKKFPSEKKVKTRFLNGKEKDEFLKENPALKSETNILITEYDSTSDEHIQGLLKQNAELAFLNVVSYIDFDRKCYDDKSLIEVINEERIEEGKSVISKDSYMDLIDWVKSKELSDLELQIFNDEIKKVERSEKTFAEEEMELLSKNAK